MIKKMILRHRVLREMHRQGLSKKKAKFLYKLGAFEIAKQREANIPIQLIVSVIVGMIEKPSIAQKM